MRVPALLMLLSAAAAIQYRYGSTAVVPAQDAVDFVSVAQRMIREGVAPTIRAEPVPPLFPAVVASTHAALSRRGWIEPTSWALSAQIAAAIPLVLVIVPLYLTTARLAGTAAAVAAAGGFMVLPIIARLGADGVSDSWHLLWVAWGVWFAVGAIAARVQNETDATIQRARHGVLRRFRERPLVDGASLQMLRWWCAGTCLGLALLVRAEAIVAAAVVAIAAGISLVASRRVAAVRGIDALSLAGGMLICLIPYLAAGVNESEALVARLRGGAAPTEDRPLNFAALADTVPAPSFDLALDDGEPMMFGHKDRSYSSRFHGFWATSREFIREFGHASGYLGLPLAIAGLAILRRRGDPTTLHPAWAIVTGVIALHLVTVFTFALSNGYLSARHFVVPVYLMLPAAGVGAAAIFGAAFAPIAALYGPHCATGTLNRSLLVVNVLFIAFMLILSHLPQPHRSQRHHRSAARIVESLARPDDAVLDQRGWTGLYTGRKTYRFDAAEEALADPKLAFVIVERADFEAPSRRGESLRAVLGNVEEALVFEATPEAPARDVLVFCQPGRFWLTAAHREGFHAR